MPRVYFDQPTLTPHGRTTQAVSLGVNSIVLGGLTILHPATHILDCDDVSWSIVRIACSDLPVMEIGVSELEKMRLYLDFQDRMLYATAADAN